MAWMVEVDSQRNNTFSSAIDVLTSYLTGQISWTNGLADSYDEISRGAQLKLALLNTSGVFNQEGLGSDIVVNGGFGTWSGGNPSSWTVTGEVGSDPEVSQVGAGKTRGEGGTGLCNLYTSSGAPVSIAQTILTSGQRYELTLAIDTLKGSGGIVVKTGTTAVSPVYHLPGIKTMVFTANATSLRIETDGAADVTIDNVTCKLAPLYYQALRKGTLIRLKWASTVLFLGRISQVSPNMGQYETDKTVTLLAECPMGELTAAEYQPRLLRDARTDQPIADVFDRATIAWPYASQGWLLGVEGCSEIGTTSKLYDSAAMMTLDEGKTRMAFFGDNQERGSGVQARATLKDCVEAECGGRFFFDTRTGKFAFHNRHRDVLNTAAAGSYSTADMAPVARLGDDVINEVVIHYEPREVGAPGTILWKSSNPIELRAGTDKKVTARYRDDATQNAQVGGVDFIVPLTRDFDLIANSARDGSGQNRSFDLTYSVEEGAAGATLHLANGTLSTIFVTTLQIRGTPLRRYDRRYVRVIDGESIRDYGLHKSTRQIVLLSDEETAQQFADTLIGRFKRPTVRIAQVTLIADGDDSLHTAQVERQPGDRVTLSDSSSVHSADYFIVGEQHQITLGGLNRHTCTWILKPADREAYWLIGTAGRGELDINAKVAF